MNHTLFDTPVIRDIMGWISSICLRAAGWQIKGKMPDIPKCVIIAAPHTSNWDLPFTLFTALVLKTNFRWMGKDTIFKRPFGTIMRWLGGIPIDRSQSGNMVLQCIQLFNTKERLMIAIPPSGTRDRVMVWKTGFYHIAAGAGVPIALGYLDYRLKTCGIGPVIKPTGNIEHDMAAIRRFYTTITGKHPEKAMV